MTPHAGEFFLAISENNSGCSAHHSGKKRNFAA